MVKLLFLCRRRPDLSHDQYAEHLLRRHVPIALRHHPRLRKYVVNIVESSPEGAEPLDSIGELYFGTVDDYRDRLYDSPEGEDAVRRDVERFLGSVHAYQTVEHVQKHRASTVPLGTRSPAVKIICPLRRSPGASHETFVDHWLRRHVPLARAHHPAMTGYVTNVVAARLSATGEEWDGVAELTFETIDDWRERLFDSPEGERAIREDISRFIGGIAPYRVSEFVQKVPPVDADPAPHT